MKMKRTVTFIFKESVVCYQSDSLIEETLPEVIQFKSVKSCLYLTNDIEQSVDLSQK